ncbi:sensor histidine kinase [Aestuariispira insulae]|uniref:histidine kinase n=1 Tax=Aestuariispira insulae TaxID=1461337 RepID=A0A3D9HS75_9PROT|nr:HAMP domain-containing sensor histidine kinase [Aestuariispira insulae]RED52344.1 histidine kinase/DNA gyrase B/HSP90-like ATPase [Aestuariispira insulae]
MLRTIRAKLTAVVAIVALLMAALGLISAISFFNFSRSVEQVTQAALLKAEAGHGLVRIADSLTALSPQLLSGNGLQRLEALQQQFEGQLNQLDQIAARTFPNNETARLDGVIRQATLLRDQSVDILKSREKIEKHLIDQQETLTTIDIQLRSILDSLEALRPEHGHAGEWTESLAARISSLHFLHTRLHSQLVRAARRNTDGKLPGGHTQINQQLRDLQRELKELSEEDIQEEHSIVLSRLRSVTNGLAAIPEFQQQITAEKERLKWRSQDFHNGVQRLSNGLVSLSATIVERSKQQIQDIEPMRVRGNLAILMSTAIAVLLVMILAAFLVSQGVAARVERLRELVLSRPQTDNMPLSIGGQDELSEICTALEKTFEEAAKSNQKLAGMNKAVQKAQERADQALSELRTTQRSLIQSEKMVSITSLVSNVAHEINTPLGAAVGVATHLSRKLERFGTKLDGGSIKKQDVKALFDFVSEGATLLQENIERTIELAKQFKQVSRQQDLDEQRLVHFGEFLKECVQEQTDLLKDREIEVAIHCPDDIEIAIHPGALGQVLTTLLGHSISHGFTEGQKGLITIMASPSSSGGLAIIYEDNGKGMSEQEKDRIFDPYFQSQQSEGGLGMLLIYSIITVRLQGTINVTSLPGEGVKFEIHLPQLAHV